jgi:hypothetical protein
LVSARSSVSRCCSPPSRCWRWRDARSWSCVPPTHGDRRATRGPVADEDGYAWIEAANAERPFLLSLQTNPEVELRRNGTLQHCHAVAVANPDGHQRIRRLLAAKYGWADRWIGWLTDTSGSLAVRLQCR